MMKETSTLHIPNKNPLNLPLSNSLTSNPKLMKMNKMIKFGLGLKSDPSQYVHLKDPAKRKLTSMVRFCHVVLTPFGNVDPNVVIV